MGHGCVAWLLPHTEGRARQAQAFSSLLLSRSVSVPTSSLSTCAFPHPPSSPTHRISFTLSFLVVDCPRSEIAQASARGRWTWVWRFWRHQTFCRTRAGCHRGQDKRLITSSVDISPSPPYMGIGVLAVAINVVGANKARARQWTCHRSLLVPPWGRRGHGSSEQF